MEARRGDEMLALAESESESEPKDELLESTGKREGREERKKGDVPRTLKAALHSGIR